MNAYIWTGSNGMRALDEAFGTDAVGGGGEGRVPVLGGPGASVARGLGPSTHSIHVQVERVLLLFDAAPVALVRAAPHGPTLTLGPLPPPGTAPRLAESPGPDFVPVRRRRTNP